MERARLRRPGTAGGRWRGVRLVAFIGLVLLASILPLPLPGPNAAADELSVAEFRQQLVNPTTIRLGKGGTQTRLAPHQDYIIKLPKGGKHGYTVLEGGRNILIDGGAIYMRGRGPDLKRRAIYIKNATGTVRIQNVVIRGRKNAEFDAIAISAPKAVVQLVNLRVEGVRGSYAGFHGDIVQPFGGVKKLVIDGLSGRSGYQGLYLVETDGRIGSVELRNIDLAYHPNRRHETTIMLWFSGCSSYPVKMRNVYIQPRKGQNLVRHAVRSNGNCNPRQNGSKVSWPGGSAIDGTIIQGKPPGGSFVRPRGR